jgi:ADP-L-glycero-D-manno-heptose 6-epimerase
MQKMPASGLYNTGTGKARTFNDLVGAIFSTLQLEKKIEYIDTPLDIRDKYQYFTEADMSKLKAAGYNDEFYSLEEGVAEYVTHFLKNRVYF